MKHYALLLLFSLSLHLNASDDSHVSSRITIKEATLAEALTIVFSKFEGQQSRQLTSFVILDKPPKSIVELSIPEKTPFEMIIQYLADGTRMSYFVKNNIVYFYTDIEDGFYLKADSPILTAQQDYRPGEEISAEWLRQVLRRHNIWTRMKLQMFNGGFLIIGDRDGVASVEALDLVMRKNVIFPANKK